MRVLFVDDDPKGLATLRASLETRRPDWTIEVCSSPAIAVLVTKREPFDVVLIADVAPFNGEDLFSYYAHRYPQIVRLSFIHNERNSRETLPNALAYQAVYSSAAAASIEDTIERSVELHRRLSNPKLSQFVSMVKGLPSPPETIIRLNEALADPNTSAYQVAEIVSEDVAIPAQILHIVNSAYFALSRNMTSIHEAVAYLGIDAVRNMALAIEMFRQMSGGSEPVATKLIESLQIHSSAVAQMTQQFAPDLNDAQDAFVGGLLHDVGHLVLATYFPSEYENIRGQVVGGRLIYETEIEIFGVAHTEIGAFLLLQWGLPIRIVDIVAFHHEAPLFTKSGMNAIHAVYLAEHLLAERQQDSDWYWEFSGMHPLSDDYLTAMGITDRIAAWRALNLGFDAQIRN